MSASRLWESRTIFDFCHTDQGVLLEGAPTLRTKIAVAVLALKFRYITSGSLIRRKSWDLLPPLSWRKLYDLPAHREPQPGPGKNRSLAKLSAARSLSPNFVRHLRGSAEAHKEGAYWKVLDQRPPRQLLLLCDQNAAQRQFGFQWRRWPAASHHRSFQLRLPFAGN